MSCLLRGDAHAYDVGWDATRECVVTGLHGHPPQSFMAGTRIPAGHLCCLCWDEQHCALCRVILVNHGELIPGDLRVVHLIPHSMRHCGPTVVGVCVDGVAQPTLTSSEIMSRNAACFGKIALGFIKYLQAKVCWVLERLTERIQGGFTGCRGTGLYCSEGALSSPLSSIGHDVWFRRFRALGIAARRRTLGFRVWAILPCKCDGSLAWLHQKPSTKTVKSET